MKFTSKQKQNILKWFKNKEYSKMVRFYRIKDLSYCLELPFTRTNINFVESNMKCKQCGRCCTIIKHRGKLNHISLVDGELKKIAKAISLKEKTVKEFYCKEIKGRWFLKAPCHFHTQYDNALNQECKIYGSRPTVCKMFPLQNPKKINYEGMPYLAITLSPHCPAVKSFLTKQWFPNLIMYKKLIEEELRQQKKWIQQQKKK